MRNIRNLVELWVEDLKEMVSRTDVAGDDKQFQTELDKVVVSFVVDEARKMGFTGFDGKSTEEVFEMIQSRHPRLFEEQNHYSRAMRLYRKSARERGKLRDIRKQHDWATSYDHLKNLLFRAITSIMIAAVILTTGYLASRWGIPLPLLRL